MNRRTFLRSASRAAAAGLALHPGTVPLRADAPTTGTRPKRLGLSIASYAIRWSRRNDPGPGAAVRWTSALDVLDHAHRLGAGCLQIGVAGWDAGFAGRVRDRREELGILLEGQIALPSADGDLARFASELDRAHEAGASIVRTVCLGGRRYETFGDAESWKRFVDESRASLRRAEPVLRRRHVRLAIENHKDWRTDELLGILHEFQSEWIGVNLDLGNNLALLEDPHEVARALAPFTLTTHFKDMAMRPCPEGFLLSEVPLGQGSLDLPGLVATCEAANPDVQFNLEMITRDPLVVPCLTERYFATMERIPAPELVRALGRSRSRPPTGTDATLPAVRGLPPEEALALEEKHVQQSFEHARRSLGLGG